MTIIVIYAIIFFILWLKDKFSRGIIQFPYRGSQGAEVDVLLVLEEHSGRYKYILPGGEIEPVDNGSFRACLRREVKEELGLEVTGHLEEYADYHAGGQHTKIYVVTELDPTKSQVWLDLAEVKGIGVYGTHNIIPSHLMFDHVSSLEARFYRANHPYARRPTINVPDFPGLLSRSSKTPRGVIPWDEQKANNFARIH